MRRDGTKFGIVGLAAALIWLAAVPAAKALYTPNPAARWAEGHFFLAGDLQFNADKDLEGGGELEDQLGIFARPTFSVARNVVVYGRLGVQDAKHLDSGFSGGFGVQGAYMLPRAPQWAIGGSFDFVYWDTNGSYVEYQFTPAFSYNVPRIPQLTPYAGIAIDFLGSDFDEEDPVGVLVGTNYDISNRLRIDAQFRMINETGFGFSVGYLF